MKMTSAVNRKLTRPDIIILIVSCLLLIAGGIWVTKIGAYTNNKMQRALTANTMLLATAIPVEEASALSFSADDLTRPEFQRIRGQLNAFNKIAGYCCVRTCALKDGQVVAGPGTLSESDARYKAPGTTCKHAAESDYQALKSCTVSITEPQSSKWGCIVKATVPVVDQSTGTSLMSVRVCVDGIAWKHRIYKAQFHVVLIFLAIFALVLCGGFLSRHKLRCESKRGFLWRHIEAIFCALVCLALTAGITYQVYIIESNRRDQAFQTLCRHYTTEVRNTFRAFERSATLLGCLFYTDEYVLSSEFTTFSKQLLLNSSIVSTAWFPKITHEQRVDFEQQVRENGWPEYHIWELGKEGHRSRAPERTIYYPSQYLEPSGEAELRIGFDSASNPDRQAALQEALGTGLPTATPKVCLSASGEPKPAILVYSSVAKETQEGVAAIGIYPEQCLENISRRVAAGEKNAHLELMDMSSEEAVFLSSASRKTEHSLERTTPLFSFGRCYALRIIPTDDWLATAALQSTPISASAGLLLTLILTAIIGGLVKRPEILERLVTLRTSELKALIANLPGAAYRSTVSSGVANDYSYVFMSDGIRAVCGYEPEAFCSNEVNWLSLITPEDREQYATELKQAIELHEPFEKEFCIVDKVGAERWIWQRSTAQYADDGTPQHLEGLVLDVTERHKAIQALDNFFDQPVNLHMIAGLDGLMHRVNNGWEHILGRSSKELVGTSFMNLIHPDDVDATSQAMTRLSNNERIDYFENRYRHRDGSYRVLAWSASASIEAGLIFAVATDITKSREAEQLAQSTLEALSAHIAILNQDGKMISSNLTWKTFSERHTFLDRGDSSGNELSILHLSSMETSPTAVRFAEGLQSVLCGDQDSFIIKYPYHTADSILWFNVRITAFTSTDIRFAVVALEDITWRYNAWEAMRQREQDFHTLTDTLPLTIYLSRGLDQICEYINPTFTKLFGYKLSDVPSIADWWSLAYPNESYRAQQEKAWTKRVKDAMCSGKQSEPMEAVVTCKDGTMKNVLWGYVPMRGKGYAVGLDVTELREAEDQFKSLATFSPAGIFKTDMLGQCIYVNPRWLEMSGLTLDEALGDGWTSALHPDDYSRVIAVWNECVKKQGNWEVEYRFCSKDGKVTWLHGIASPLTDHLGKTIGYIGVNTDVTETKNTQLKLEEHARALELFNKAATGRELRMIELKKELNMLCKELNRDAVYSLPESVETDS